MATNKFATMLHRNTHKMIVILVYAVLEWILIFLLLLNSLFSYFITKFAEYFGLKPPCQLCSRFDHLLDPKNTTNSYLDLVCEAHANEISRLSYCSNHHKFADSDKICANCSDFELEISPKMAFFTWVSENGSEHGEKNDGFCSCCDEKLISSKLFSSYVLFRPCLDVLDYTQKLNLIEEIIGKEEVVDDYEHHMLSDVDSFSFGPAMEEDCSMSLMNFKCNDAKEEIQMCDRDDDSIGVEMNPCWMDYCDIDRLVPVELIDSSTVESQNSCALQANSKGPKQFEEAILGEISPMIKEAEEEELLPPLREKKEPGAEESLDGSVTSEMDSEDGAKSIEQLRSALRAQKKALSALYKELEEERSAAAIAANQTMAMITTLQEEKAEVEMEALQYQRMMEEQAEYDQEALQLLNELMLKREKEKQELENELELYRKKVFDQESKEKSILRKRSGSFRSKNSSTSSSVAEDSEDQESTNYSPTMNEVVDYEHTVHDSTKHLSILDESLAEFEEERMSILEELKALEEKLFTLADDEERPFEHFTLDLESNEHHPHDYIKEFDKNYTCTSLEESEISTGFSEEPNGKMDYSAAKRLLPLFDEEEVKSHSANSLGNRIEVDRVYERLMDLEADREFLKHSISSLKKGDKGKDLLEEILQNLRDLRTVELRMRNIGDGSIVCSSI
ncbi:hypothetical protein LguiA_005434 [Lonicera macranthoides]